MKQTLVINLIFFLSLSSFAGVLLEPLPTTQKIYRSRAFKKNEYKQLKDLGITSVLIFKNQLKDEVDLEVTELLKIGIDRRKIFNIPFEWKNLISVEQSCRQTLSALKILAEVQRSSNDKIVFHCTVGEDRTGMLAGLMTQLLTGQSASKVYREQMCGKDFSGGNGNKPLSVSKLVDLNITPIYFIVSKMIADGVVTLNNIDENSCGGAQSLFEGLGRIKKCSAKK